ncbi:MAG: hypothetical protein RLZZ06_66 [Actinomycetota bacterium]|jgi:hypothetical protein
MKHKILFAGVGVFAALTLSGCSMFYPNPTPTPTHTLEPTKTPTPTPTPTEDPSLKKVTIGIIDSSAFVDNGYVEVVAEAQGVLEDDGKCVLTLTQGDIKQEVTVTAVQNVNSTVCASMQSPLSNFKTAPINFSVKYTSSKSTGTSANGTIQIQ